MALPSFEPYPLGDVSLGCFVNFPEMKNQDLCREIQFQENYLIKIINHDMVGAIPYSEVYYNHIRAFYEYL